MEILKSNAPAKSSFTDMIDLANENIGGKMLYATDDFFAEKENLLKSETPIFITDKYTDLGKWMDGWESRRKRVAGHDHAIIQLGAPGIICGFNIDTSFFTGNFPEYAMIEGVEIEGKITLEKLHQAKWTTILHKTQLSGHTQNLFGITNNKRFTHLRFHIYPDGGVARLRVHGKVIPHKNNLKGKIDLAASVNGATVISASDYHYGSKDSLILPNRAKVMGEGWETKRSRGTHHDWIIVKLCGTGKIHEIEIDTNHYKGNFPDSCSIEVLKTKEAHLLPCDFRDRTDLKWTEILPRTKLKASHQHFFAKELNAEVAKNGATYMKITIHPDGGISRLRVKGELLK
jgi:allantoicase